MVRLDPLPLPSRIFLKPISRSPEARRPPYKGAMQRLLALSSIVATASIVNSACPPLTADASSTHFDSDNNNNNSWHSWHHSTAPFPPLSPLLVVNSTAPLGVAAYAGLASNFPLAQFMGSVASRMQRPYTSLLLDFHRMLVWDNATMFTDGPVGERTANPRHLAALARFADAYLDATAATRADSASLLIFVLNGPDGRGERWKSNLTRVAYSMPPAELNEALCTDSAVRAELASFIRAVVGVLAPRVAKGLQIRLTGMLEDNLNRRGALALHDVMVRLGGWPWAYGRNVCPGCTPEIVADASRVGTYWEKHINHEQDMPALLALHQPFDDWSNDGWLGDISVSNITEIVSMGQSKQLWTHYWEESIQGYSYPPGPGGRPTLRFKLAPEALVAALCEGTASASPQNCTALRLQLERRNGALD